MNNIHLHSDNQPKGILKEDINKQENIEYRKSLPYDAMGDYSTILNESANKAIDHEALNHKCVIKIPSEPINRLNELTERETMQKLDSLIQKMTGFSCVAEYNHYRNNGG